MYVNVAAPFRRTCSFPIHSFPGLSIIVYVINLIRDNENFEYFIGNLLRDKHVRMYAVEHAMRHFHTYSEQ